jgi:hypothetical protein
MHLRQASLAPSPYGLAFSIEELILVRSWAEQRDLVLTVALDHVVDGAEFEEMLIIAPHNRQRRTLSIWRTSAGVFAQTPHGRPRGFATVKETLEAIRPAPARRKSWLSRIGFSHKMVP